MAELLRGRGLALSLGGRERLADIDLHLEAGEVLALLGPNGAGKSCLLRVLTGLWPASRGEVFFNGRHQRHWSPGKRARLLAVLSQSLTLEFPFAVEEVLLLGRIPHGSGRQRDRQIVEAAMAQADILHLRGEDYRHLSGGEKQRVQLARVLAQIWDADEGGERLLVLDEPSASLDLAHQRLLAATVRQFAERGVGVLLVMHDLNLAASCADRLLLLRQGRVAALGRPAEVLRPDLLGDVFGVSVSLLLRQNSAVPLVLTA